MARIIMKRIHTPRCGTLLSGVTVLALSLAACGGSSDQAGPANTAAHDEHDHEGATEAAARSPRVVLTYDGGLLVVDATTLEQVGDLPLEGFSRVAPAGDGRYVMVSTAGGWAPLDTGTWAQAHGDHFHFFTAEPELHDVLVAAETPGHVVVHDDLTALFDDGTGDVTVLPSGSWDEAVEAGEVTPTRSYTTPSAHHGVAVATANGNLLVTEGTEDQRTGARLLDTADTVVAESDRCPGVHGEGTTAEYLMVGCEDGLLVFLDDHVHKITSPDAFGRIGNIFPAEGSTIVLGDYKTDPEGGLGLTSIALTDLAAETMTVTDTGTQYTWRGLARGEEGEVLVLGTDGTLRVLDPATGAATRTIPVIDAWQVPTDWQDAHPALLATGSMAYITDPATNTLHVVDYAGGSVWKSAELSHAPIEMAPATS